MITAGFLRAKWGNIPGRGQAERMRISLFVTCLADTLYPEVGQATVTLLERLGHQVDFPAAQGCCGQMHVNTGYQRAALPLVRRYVGDVRGRRRHRHPVGIVRGLGPAPARDGGPAARRRGAGPPRRGGRVPHL